MIRVRVRGSDSTIFLADSYFTFERAHSRSLKKHAPIGREKDQRKVT